MPSMSCPKPHCCAVALPALQVFDAIVGVFASQRHREPELAAIQVVGAATDYGPGGQHVIQARQTVAPACQQVQAEIFGVAVCRGEHPEQQLRAQQGGEVLVTGFRAMEDASDVD